jgi:hypothetical protein
MRNVLFDFTDASAVRAWIDDRVMGSIPRKR